MNLSKKHQISRLRIIVLVILVAVLGTALTLYGRAATGYSLQAAIETETFSASSNVGRILSDYKASAGKSLELFSEGTAQSATFTTTDTTVKIQTIAKGTACNGQPKMIVKVDGIQQGSTYSVGSTSWTTYDTNVKLSAGRHNVRISFPNDYYKRGGRCDRNLFLDKVSLFANQPLPSDATKPAVLISAPANGTTISGVTAITATATDNVSVSKVEFYADGKLLTTKLSSPYAASIDSATLVAGAHSIEVRAYDPAGNVGIAQSTVTVLGTPAPTTTPTSTTTTGSNIGFFPNATAFTAPVSNPVVRSDSAAFMTQFTSGKFWTPNLTLRDYGVSLVYGTGAFTAYPAPPPSEGNQYIGSAGKMLVPKVPPGTKAAGGTDGHLAVIVGDTVYEIYKATISADGTITNAKAVARANLKGNGQTNTTDAPSNAAGLSLLAGIITPQELASKHIDHALAFSVPGIKSGSALFPAWENVYVSGPNTTLVEGSKIYLSAPQATINALAEPYKTIAQAMKTHGAYLRDNGGTFGIIGVVSNDWPSSYGTGSSLRLDPIPWSYIQVIQGPTK
ncbi:MAG: Ig-like domain-containing protein [Patescibacteria group bacterium]